MRLVSVSSVSLTLLVPVHEAEVQRKPAGLVGGIEPHCFPVYLHLEGFVKALYCEAVLLGKLQLCQEAQQHLYGVLAVFGHGGVSRHAGCGYP